MAPSGDRSLSSRTLPEGRRPTGTWPAGRWPAFGAPVGRRLVPHSPLARRAARGRGIVAGGAGIMSARVSGTTFDRSNRQGPLRPRGDVVVGYDSAFPHLEDPAMSKDRPTVGTDGNALPILPPERDARVWARMVRVMFYTPGFLALLLLKTGVNRRASASRWSSDAGERGGGRGRLVHRHAIDGRRGADHSSRTATWVRVAGARAARRRPVSLRGPRRCSTRSRTARCCTRGPPAPWMCRSASPSSCP